MLDYVRAILTASENMERRHIRMELKYSTIHVVRNTNYDIYQLYTDNCGLEV